MQKRKCFGSAESTACCVRAYGQVCQVCVCTRLLGLRGTALCVCNGVAASSLVTADAYYWVCQASSASGKPSVPRTERHSPCSDKRRNAGSLSGCCLHWLVAAAAVSCDRSAVSGGKGSAAEQVRQLFCPWPGGSHLLAAMPAQVSRMPRARARVTLSEATQPCRASSQGR